MSRERALVPHALAFLYPDARATPAETTKPAVEAGIVKYRSIPLPTVAPLSRAVRTNG